MKFYYSEKLSRFATLLHAFTTKECGNLAFHVGDDALHVQNNHAMLAEELGFDKEMLVHMKQIHSDIVHVVKDEGFDTPPTCDALVTDEKDAVLMVMVADCSPVLFYDDEREVIAAAHAGRQGAFKNIAKNVLETMSREFGSDPKNIHVSIGSSIKSCCYEVGGEIYDEAKSLSMEYAMQKREGRSYLDINAIIKTQLLECGVQEKNIETSNECTSCKADAYYSYRAEGRTGRFAGLIMLKSP